MTADQIMRAADLLTTHYKYVSALSRLKDDNMQPIRLARGAQSNTLICEVPQPLVVNMIDRERIEIERQLVQMGVQL